MSDFKEIIKTSLLDAFYDFGIDVLTELKKTPKKTKRKPKVKKNVS